VTVEGGKLRKHKAQENVAELVAALPQPPVPSLTKPFNLVVTGIAAPGVITVGALLGMAGAYRGQGQLRARFDRPGAEERLRPLLCPRRQHAGGPAHRPHPAGRDRLPDRLRHGGGRRRESMVALAKGRTKGVVNGNVTRPPPSCSTPHVDTDTSELSNRLIRTLGKDALDFNRCAGAVGPPAGRRHRPEHHADGRGLSEGPAACRA